MRAVATLALALAAAGCGRHGAPPAPAAPASPAADSAASPGSAANSAASAPSAPSDYPRLAICVPDWTKGGAPRLKIVGEATTVGASLVRQRLDALLADPEGGFPAGAKLLALYELRGGLWVADLSGELRKLQGSAGERAAVSALVETVALDQQDFTGLRLLIDGQPADALGHLDLTGSFAATGGCAGR